MCGCNKNSNTLNAVQRNTVGLSKCPELHEVLRSLDLRVINLLNKESNSLLMETNRQLRLWMRNLNKYCPSEEEIETVRLFLENSENNK